MMRKIENDYLSVGINEKGAEIFSITSKSTGVEYLWQGNPEYWSGRSPVLFPICGRLFNGKYTYNGIEYEMPIHGIARLFDFVVNCISKNEIELVLISSEETKKYYPFDFKFSIHYILNDRALDVGIKVENMGDNDMYFSFGAHPGFNVPFTNNEKFEDYYIEFGKNEFNKLVFSDTCFCTGKTQEINLNQNKLLLTHSLFDNDGVFLETEADVIRLKNKNNNNAIEISYNDMTCLGFWHKPKSDAPYVCIEPWHGIPSDDGVIDDITTKKQMIKLESKRTYTNVYTIKIIEK